MTHGKHSTKQKQKQSVSRCKCGRIARPRQRNCKICHADAQRAFRFRRKDMAKRLEKQLNRFAKIVRNLEAGA